MFVKGLDRRLERSLLIFRNFDVHSHVVDQLGRRRAVRDRRAQRRIRLGMELRRLSFQEDTREMFCERLRLIPFAESQVNVDDIKATFITRGFCEIRQGTQHLPVGAGGAERRDELPQDRACVAYAGGGNRSVLAMSRAVVAASVC